MIHRVGWLLPVLALSMGGLGFYHVQQTSQSSPATAPLEHPARVPFERSWPAPAWSKRRRRTSPSAHALPGLVLEVYVPSNKVGTHVQAGTPLFRIDDRHLKAQLAVAEAQVNSAKAAPGKTAAAAPARGASSQSRQGQGRRQPRRPSWRTSIDERATADRLGRNLPRGVRDTATNLRSGHPRAGPGPG